MLKVYIYTICVRRGKSCPKGVIPRYYICHKNNIDRELCPIKTLKAYQEEWGDLLFSGEGSFVFPSNHVYQSHKISEKAITDRWNKACKDLDLPKDQYVQAHSGHRLLVLMGLALKVSKEQIMEATSWSSTKVLPMYAEGPTENGLTKQIASLPVSDLDSRLQSQLSFESNKNKCGAD